MTKNKMIQPGTEDMKRKGVARNSEGKILGNKKRLEIFHPSTHVQVKRC
jgi:hypothetical protein